jgi:beta-lactamase regulating signal transducer with metallopeptidase domain/biotin carboxyl carrier protein
MNPEPTSAFAAALLRASWQGAAAVALAWLACRALPTLPSAWRCWIWRAAFARLLLSLTIAGAIALPLLPAPPTPAPPVPELPSFTPAEPIAPASIPDAPRAAHGHRPRLTELLVLAWSFGVVAWTLATFRAGARVRALRRNARPVTDTRLLQACDDLCGRLRVARAPELLTSSQIDTPALVGLIRPAILLPAAHRPPGAAESEAMRMMLAHELAHLARRDLWWNWLPAVAQALLWFHPLAWLASRELRLAQETACDALAMSATGAPPCRYGAMLLDVIEAVRGNRRPPAAFAAAVVETRWSVERRLTAMTHFTPAPRSRRARVAGAAALLAALALAVVPWRLSAQPGAPKAPAPSADVPSGVGPADVTPGQPAPAGPLPGAGGLPGLPGQPDSPPFEIMQFTGVVTAPTFSLGLASGGLVTEVPVNTGDAVKTGQLIARIDDTAARGALVEAEAGLQLKQAQLKRMAELYRQKATSEADIQVAEAEVQIAQARIATVRHALEATRVMAPCDGVISEVNVRPGELAGNGRALAQIMEVNKLSLAFELPAQWLPKVKVGQQVKVSVDAMPDGAFDATIESISPVVNAASGTVGVRARLADTKGAVRPGMTGRVSFGAAK